MVENTRVKRLNERDLRRGRYVLYWMQAQRALFNPAPDRRAYLEELIVRRELAANFVAFEPRHEEYACVPGWARATLAAHRADPRPHLYTRAQLESAGTHDPYWNAAMREMRDTGFMHNSMRMYWAKKILEWIAAPRRRSGPRCT